MMTLRIAILLGLLGCAGTANARDADPAKPVFILAGQSNMEGQAVVDLDGKDYNDGKGTLAAMLKDPAKAPLVKHHEFGNAETYFLVGDALAKGMIKLLAPPAKQPGEPAKPTAHTERKLEGWTIRVDDRLLQGPDEALGARALRFLEAKLSDIKVVVPEDKVNDESAWDDDDDDD